MKDNKTQRGQFRGVKMEDLDVWANSSIWDAEKSGVHYILPLKLTLEQSKTQGDSLTSGIPENELYYTAQYLCARSPLTHRAAFKNAIDFLVMDGSEIVATADGVVVEIQEHSDEWGIDIKYRDSLNYLTIRHRNGEFTQYCHLARHSVSEAGICVGAQVIQGQVIAKVGKSGLTDRDHLHFIVFKSFKNESPFQFKSLVPCFE